MHLPPLPSRSFSRLQRPVSLPTIGSFAAHWIGPLALVVSAWALAPQEVRSQEYRDPDFRCDVAQERFDFVARELERHAPQMAWLIGDSVFVPITGVPFDEVSSEDRRDLVDDFEDCLEGKEYEELVFHMNWRLNIGADNWRYERRIDRPLAEMRAAWDFLEEARRFNWDTMRFRWLRYRNGLRRWMFPSAFEELEEVMAAAEERQEEGALANQVRQILERPLGDDLPVTIAEWTQRLDAYDGSVPPNRVAEMRRQLQARLDSVYPLWLDSLRAEFRAMSPSLESLVSAGYMAYRLEYWLPEYFDNDPALAAILKDYYERRNDQLEAAAPLLYAQIDSTETIEEVREILIRFLRADGDRGLPAAGPILRRMAERTEALQVADALGWSDAELSAYERTGHTPSAARFTEIDLYRAVDRWVREDVNLPYRLLDDITAWATPDERVLVTPTNVRLRRCERVSPTRVQCEYQYGLDTNFYGTQEGRPQDPFAGLMQALATLGRAGEVATSGFEFRGDRWALMR